MSSEEGGFFGFLNRCVSGLISFVLAVLIGFVVLVSAGWMVQVWMGRESSSDYFKRFSDFYHHPEETPVGRWALETYRSFKAKGREGL